MSQAALGLLIIGAFLMICLGEAAAIIVLAYKVGVYKGKLARYESIEKQPPAREN